MSKSVKRVVRALAEAGVETEVIEMPDTTRTAAEAAAAVGCAVDQIAKSIIFQGESSGRVVLFLTAGGNTVSAEKGAALLGEPLARADAAKVRAVTGFAIGGVAPLGHLSPIQAFFDNRLAAFETVWAAGGTPRHVFEITPAALLAATGADRADFTA